MRGRQHSFRRQVQPCHSARNHWRDRLAGVAPLLAAIGCGLTATGAILGGETHFLGNCGDGCADGLSCLGGICTRPCVDGATDCAELASGVSCRQEPAAEAHCDLPCSTDASCAAVGPDLVCEDGFCRAAVATAGLAASSAAPVGRADDPWWCLGLSPEEPSTSAGAAPMALVTPVLDWATLQPLTGQGLSATLCSIADFSCQEPLGAPYEVAGGSLGALMLSAGAGAFPVPQGFDGVVRFGIPAEGVPEADRYLPVVYFLNGVASGAVAVMPPLLMMQTRLWELVLERSFPDVDPAAARASGTVLASVWDCNGQPVLDARMEIAQAGEMPPLLAAFQVPASRIPVAQPPEQLRSSADGVGFLGVPAGFVAITAFRPEDDQRIGTLPLGVVPGQITMGMIRPDYFRSVGIPGGTALSGTLEALP